jgi:ribonuclease HI
LLFPASNNAAEYEALIHGLNIAISLGVKRLMVYGDSLVVISQINKEWTVQVIQWENIALPSENWKINSRVWNFII